MFVVIYKFTIHPENETVFIKAWHDLTNLIYEFEGSLGSRLHKETENSFIAYAQWPNETKFNNSGNNLPHFADDIRKIMRESCEKVEVLHKMKIVNDLLR